MNPVHDVQAAFGKLTASMARFNPLARNVQIGRTIIAVAQLVTLTLTTWPNLTTDVAGRDATGYCAGIRAASLFCLGSDTPHIVGWWVGSSILLLVIAGIYPRLVAILHAWLALSMNASLSLPDGGEAVAVFATIILILVAFADPRFCAWCQRDAKVSMHLRAVSYAGSIALCIQLAGIYFESGLAKLAVDDWVSGNALYYIVRDPYFGASGALGSLLRWLTDQPIGTATLTWGTSVIECAIAVFLLAPWRYKRYALLGVVILHLGIAVALGLWSFSLIMIGASAVASYELRHTMSPRPVPEAVDDSQETRDPGPRDPGRGDYSSLDRFHYPG
jgi:antimicrobial peptide system SdpB family protein